MSQTWQETPDGNAYSTPDDSPVAGTASGEDNKDGNGFNWNQLINTLGQTAVGMWGQPVQQQPGAPGVIIDRGQSTTILITVLVLVVAAVALFFILRKK